VKSARARRARGFTLVELLVVVCVLVLLIAIGFTVITKATRSAARNRVKRDFQTIASALEVYKQDFGGYPVVTHRAGSDPESLATQKGSYVLARWLIGPGCYDGEPLPGDGSRPGDGYPGPGYGYGPPNAQGIPTGPVHAAILQPGQIRVSPDPAKVPRFYRGTFELIDYLDNPIQYYPRHKPDQAAGPPLLVYTGGDPRRFLYWASDGDVPAALLQGMLGDENLNNAIDAFETLRFNGDFILATRGDAPWIQPRPGKVNADVSACENIFNFGR